MTSRLNKFRCFITNPPKFYCDLNPRYPDNYGATCDNCGEEVSGHFGQPPNLDLCTRCFVIINTLAAEEEYDRLHEPRWKKIVKVNWNEADLTDPPQFTVYFEDGTTGGGTEEEINEELVRQKNYYKQRSTSCQETQQLY